jgi:putative toxin-antitoxin system antitoxin component (TIGR02293 family)
MENLLTIPHDPVSLIKRSESGIPKSAVISFQHEVGLSNEELADALQISVRAFLGYDNADILKQRVSERVLLLANLYKRGFEVMGKERFLRWMNKELIVFGNSKAKTMLKSIFGIQILLDELGRIEHGVLA